MTEQKAKMQSPWDRAAAPGGRRRTRLLDALAEALADDFEAHGPVAIEALREKNPAAYLRLVADIMPEAPPRDALDGMTDDELEAALADVRQVLAMHKEADPEDEGAA